MTETQKMEGEPCATDDECDTGLCDQLPGREKVCFRKCSAGCEPNEVCNALAPNDRFACLEERPSLCLSCSLDVDCAYPGDKCLAVGGAQVCGRDCSFDGRCPSSYRCADAIGSDGTARQRQCVPVSGTCQCTAASAGLTIPCEESNNLGTCMGVQTCNPPGGFDACSARVPTTETCNGRDDDCNGETDENLGDTSCGVGECRRSVSNCVNGVPQTCVPGALVAETCDERDNDCDGVIDNGFDKMTSLQHCGACNTPCQRTRATAACTAGVCAIAMCDPGFVNADGVDANGCEYACVASGAESCDGLDNDCDGQTDEDFMLQTDPANCGMCGKVCAVNNGNVMSYACTAGNCGIGSCNAGFSDCDTMYASGCELPTSADINNCGACNRRCTAANATAACVSSNCAIGTCNAGFGDCNTTFADGCETNTNTTLAHCGRCNNQCPTRANSMPTCAAGGCGIRCNANFYDLDGNVLNGCEYACTATGSDVPDLNGTDANCDGVDGDIASSIFVDGTGGNDANPGTLAAPKRSITAGIGAAQAGSKVSVLVGEGTYNEAVTLVSGISLYGGYRPTSGWSRPAAAVTEIRAPNATGVVGRNLSGTLEVQKVSLFSLNATGTAGDGAGLSSSAMLLQNAGSVTLRGVVLTPGAGSNAISSSPTNGAPGAPGGGGGNGGDGISGAGGAAGTPGVSLCGANGGQGGAGKLGQTTDTTSLNNGNNGLDGTQAPGGGAASSGGTAGHGGGCDDDTQPQVTNGQPVNGASAGPNGAAGPQGPQKGSFDSAGVYSPASGNAGTTGGPGGGAGGGGSGGGTPRTTAGIGCTSCSQRLMSGGGGGGGAGGCGGQPGQGGRGGGGSFGLIAVGTVVTMQSSQIRTATGGSGQPGSSGGGGGQGGTGGTGGNGESRSGGCATRTAGAGAQGGQGGIGGNGGGGSGGPGGPSVCVAYVGAAPTLNAVDCVPQSGGAGGPGGFTGSQPAPNGIGGLSSNLVGF